MPEKKRVVREAETMTAAADFQFAADRIFCQLESLARRLGEPEGGWAVDPTLRRLIGATGDLREARREVREIAARAYTDAVDAYDRRAGRNREIAAIKAAGELLVALDALAKPTTRKGAAQEDRDNRMTDLSEEERLARIAAKGAGKGLLIIGATQEDHHGRIEKLGPVDISWHP